MSNEEVLTHYSRRWSIETYFRSAKVHLGMDRYQLKSTKAIDRYLTLIAFVSMCCTYFGANHFLDGMYRYREEKQVQWIEYIYKQAQSGVSLAEVKTQLRVA
ncbi:transposase [Paenibacillus larvae]|uniref:transposase n=1 Tax=Paenibacillus larvae TaxID=1464 RepID=UPI001319EA1C|nr:transposase [Paenibacillus larvae]MCY9745919.1 transposase [Paenibacillus larvae]MCY9751408.1 transposase [Paenibacillus larvae]